MVKVLSFAYSILAVFLISLWATGTEHSDLVFMSASFSWVIGHLFRLEDKINNISKGE